MFEFKNLNPLHHYHKMVSVLETGTSNVQINILFSAMSNVELK